MGIMTRPRQEREDAKEVRHERRSRSRSRSRSRERTREKARDRRRRSRSRSRSTSHHDRRNRSPSEHRRRSHRREVDVEESKRRNREDVAHRSRMWTTVGSDSDDDNAATQPRRSRSHERKRRRRHASSSSSSSSESDSSSLSSGSDSRHRKKHRSKHKKKDRKKSKDKKRKTTKKKKKKSHAVNQNEYGKYGILRESDFHTKAQSFQAWLRDIKKVTEFNGPKWEAMEYFKEYMEDYNTATMPHEKYYDIEKYEMRKYEKHQKKKARKHLEVAVSSRAGSEVPDEDAVRRERQAERTAKEQEEFRLIMQTMDKDKIEAMRRQEQLRAEMQMHYKAGNVEEARRLEQLLRAEEK